MSVQVPKGYKQTEVGVIPKDWDLLKLGDVCEIKGRIGFRGYTVNDIVEKGYGAISISPSNINNGKINFERSTYISFDKYEESPEIKIFNGDIVLVKTGSTFGKVALVDGLFEKATLNPQVVVVKKIKINNLYLSFLMGFETFQSQISSSVVGGALPTLSQKLVEKFKIPCPPTFVEQMAVGKALSDADALIESLEQLIAKKRQIKQGAMQELLTGQRRLPGFSGEWKNISFNEALFRIKAKKYQIGTSDYNESGLYPVVDQSQVDIVGYSDNKEKLLNTPHDGLIVFGDHTCVVKYVDFDFLVGADGTQILCANDGGSTKFYYWLLNFDGVKSTGYNRHYKFLQDKIFQVPDLEEQEEIANQLFAIEHEINALQRSVGKHKKIKQAMMQELLTGRIRLI